MASFFKTPIILLLASLAGGLSCHSPKSDGVSQTTAGPLTKETCRLDSQTLLGQLDTDCRDNILGRVPLKELLGILNPKDPVLQEQIFRRVSKDWPEWLLQKVTVKGRPTESIVTYYLAFLKMPYSLEIFAKNPSSAALQTIVSGLPRATAAGPVGDHAIAYVDTKEWRIVVYDTLERRTVFSQPLPRSQYHPLYLGGIEALGTGTFLVYLDYLDDQNRQKTEVTVWNWRQPSAINPVYRNSALAMDVSTNRARIGVLRISDTQFAALRWQDPREKKAKVLDIWDISRGKMIQTITKDHLFDEDTREATLRDLKLLERDGIKLASTAFSSYNNWLLGTKVDERTVIYAADGQDVFLASPDYRQTRRILRIRKTEGASPGLIHIRFITKNGDIVASSSDLHGLRALNIWKVVEILGGEAMRTRPCPRPS